MNGIGDDDMGHGRTLSGCRQCIERNDDPGGKKDDRRTDLRPLCGNSGRQNEPGAAGGLQDDDGGARPPAGSEQDLGAQSQAREGRSARSARTSSRAATRSASASARSLSASSPATGVRPIRPSAHERIGKQVGLPADKVEAILAGMPTPFDDEREQIVYEMAIVLTNGRWVPRGLLRARGQGAGPRQHHRRHHLDGALQQRRDDARLLRRAGRRDGHGALSQPPGEVAGDALACGGFQQGRLLPGTTLFGDRAARAEAAAARRVRARSAARPSAARAGACARRAASGTGTAEIRERV